MAKQFARFQVSSRLAHLLSQEYSSSEKALKELVDTSAHGRPGRGRRQRTGGAGRGQRMTSGARKTDPDAAGHRPSGARLRCLLPRGLPKDKVLQTFGAHIFSMTRKPMSRQPRRWCLLARCPMRAAPCVRRTGRHLLICRKPRPKSRNKNIYIDR